MIPMTVAAERSRLAIYNQDRTMSHDMLKRNRSGQLELKNDWDKPQQYFE